MAGDDTLRFYYPLPNYGVKLSRQWPKFREDFQALAPLVRAAYVDLQPASANAPGEHDISGWAIGKRDFRNKYRIWYDQVNLRFSVQHNTGTEAIPVWEDVITLRESDGRVTIAKTGGLDSHIGGFYPSISQGASAGDFYGVTVKTTNGKSFRGINTIEFDRGGFYLGQNSPNTDSVIVSAANAKISFNDGRSVYNAREVGFNKDQFYLSTGVGGKPVVNIAAKYAPNGCVTMIRSADSNNATTLSAQWKVYNENGESISTAGSTSEGLQEAISYAAAQGYDLKVYGGGRATAKNNQNIAIISCTNTITVPPIEGVRWDIHATINFGGSPAGSPAGILFDSILASTIVFHDQIVVGVSSYGSGVRFAPRTFLPSDDVAGNVITSSTIRLPSVVKVGGICIDLDCTNGGISSNFFDFMEPNGGATGVKVTCGVNKSFDNNIVNIIDCHAQDTCINAGSDNTLGNNCFGNSWNVQCDPTAGGVGIEIYSKNDHFNASITNLEGQPTNGITLNTIASKNTIILRKNDATVPINPVASASTGDNVIITPTGSGTINFGGQKLTNLGAPTANSDAARLQDVIDKSDHFYGIYVKESDDSYSERDDVIVFTSSDFNVSSVSNKPTVTIVDSGIDHSQLANLTSGDPHTQYLLASQASSRANFDTTWADLTDGTETGLHTHPGASPGFYGITVASTTPVFGYKNINTIKFLSTDFYITQNSPNTDEAVVSLRLSKEATLSGANVFTSPTPVTTPAESWIGPSATDGVAFKTSNVGIGTAAPTQKLMVVGNVLVDDGGNTSYIAGGIAGVGRITFRDPDVGHMAFNTDFGYVFKSSNVVKVTFTSGGNVEVGGTVKFGGTNSTGAQTATLGTNAPAAMVTLTPYTWITAVAADGSTVYIPCWK